MTTDWAKKHPDSVDKINKLAAEFEARPLSPGTEGTASRHPEDVWRCSIPA